MDPKFASLVDRLHPALLTLAERAPVTGGVIPGYGGAVRGVYLFTEAGNHLYVGRSNRLLARYRNHWMPNKSEREAAFAFKLARELTGFTKATYKRGAGSRKALALDPGFIAALTASKARIKAMEYRWVEETDPTCQCSVDSSGVPMEVYVPITMETFESIRPRPPTR